MVYLAFPGTKKPGEGWVQRVSLQLFPGFMRPQRPTREVIPWYDYALAIIAGMGALYMAWDYVNIIQRSGLPIQRDVIIGAILVVLLLEAARRALGPALPILAILFLLYCFAGPYMPSFIAHPGVPLEFVVDHMYLSDSGIWGVPIGVSTSFVFLFVLFGSLLDKAGAANYFVQVAFAALGRFRGGPAKAAVVASGMTGLVSGSSIANVATTGTFTIPLMKKVGLPDYKAGAVEVGREHERAAHAAGHGRRRVHHGGVSGSGLPGRGARRDTAGPALLHRPFLRGSPRSAQARLEAARSG